MENSDSCTPKLEPLLDVPLLRNVMYCGAKCQADMQSCRFDQKIKAATDEQSQANTSALDVMRLSFQAKYDELANTQRTNFDQLSFAQQQLLDKHGSDISTLSNAHNDLRDSHDVLRRDLIAAGDTNTHNDTATANSAHSTLESMSRPLTLPREL